MSPLTDPAISQDSGAHWTEEGAWAVGPGVWRIPLPLPNDGLRAVNVYALAVDEGLTLIDGGWALEASHEVLRRALAPLGFSVRDIRRFLVTHAHRDHYTQAVTLRRLTGAKVHLGELERTNLEAMHRRPANETPQIALLEHAGAPDLAKAWSIFSASHQIDLSQWELPDRWVADSQAVDLGSRVLTAVATPGHTRGHVVYADLSDAVLFAGDHVLPTITPSIGFEADPTPLPLRDFMSTLAKVRQMPDMQLLPAHGPVATSTHARVDELLSHHEARLQSCLDVVRPEGATAAEVAAALPWTRRHHSLAELDQFNGGLAVLETRAHLELLVDRGQLAATQVGKAAVYMALPASSAQAD